jgi:tellurite resistance protein TerC
MSEFPLSFWLGFFIFVFSSLALDLGFFNKKPRSLSFKEAMTITGIWFLLASFFCSFLYYKTGHKQALEFLTGYIIELSLSIDNVFVIALVFSYFNIPLKYQHRVLFWGIIGAIVMRFIMISFGIMLVHSFTYIFVALGLLLVVSGVKIAFEQSENKDELADNRLVNYLKSKIRLTNSLYEEKFFTRIGGKLHATPLFLVLIIVEQTDLVFAIDSIPAILAITQNSFIVFTSNIFAILGLRAMYFMLLSLIHKFAYLKYGLAGILVFIGGKMAIIPFGIKIDTGMSLAVVFVFLIGSICYSMYKSQDTALLS